MTLSGICAEPKNNQKPAPQKGTRKSQPTSSERKRIALVIGNSRYSPKPLTTPSNDAHVLSATLRRIGFEVHEKSNLNSGSLKKAVSAFGKNLKGKEVGFFYFAGHGVQSGGKNYLIPVGEKISSEKDVRTKAVSLDLILETIKKSGSRAGIIVIDASRESPPAGKFDSASSGLAPIEAPAGTILAYAAAPGKTAPEGNGSTGLYTSALVHSLDIPGIKIGEAFQQIRTRVATVTNQTQVPWESNSFPEDLLLVPPFDPTPRGSNVERASALISGDATKSKPLRGFTEPISGIEFVPVPGGCYEMGDTFNIGFHWEQPVHTVCISDFSIGKFEVTQGQWKRVVGSAHAYFSTCGDDCPVEQVSWNDAQEFIRELNRQTGGSYRLPTEAEWEYAARSGGRDEMFSGGSDADAVAWLVQNSNSSTQNVGTKQANGLGINDMSGNVWEWVQDWYGTYDSVRQVNPTGPATGTVRVFRGGSWSHGSVNARTAIRYYNTPETRINFLGFRLVAPAIR